MPSALFDYIPGSFHTMGAVSNQSSGRFSFTMPKTGKTWTLSKADDARARAFYCGGGGGGTGGPTPMTCPILSQTIMTEASSFGQVLALQKRFDDNRSWDDGLQSMADSWILANVRIPVADLRKYPTECAQQYQSILGTIRGSFQMELSKYPPLYRSR